METRKQRKARRHKKPRVKKEQPTPKREPAPEREEGRRWLPDGKGPGLKKRFEKRRAKKRGKGV